MPPLPHPSLALVLLAGAALAAGAVLGTRHAPGPDDPVWRLRWGAWRVLARLGRNPGATWHRRGLAQGDPERGVPCLEEAARYDHPEAHFELGLWYEEGGHGPGSRDRAARHYRAAAEAGHAEACFRLAELLGWGIGPARDPGVALRWYQRSAQGGFRPAMEALARIYETAEGVPEDLEKSVAWTLQAREAEPAPLRCSRFARPSPARAPAPEPGPEAGPNAEADARFRLGMGLLSEGRDPAAALGWLRRAAEGGHLEAMGELGRLLAETGDPEGEVWLRRAAALGHPGAQVRLGHLRGRTAAGPGRG